MSKNKFAKGAVLIGLLVLPFLVYFLLVYNAEENFFVKLKYVGPKQFVENADGTKDSLLYTIPSFGFTTQDDTLLTNKHLKNKITLVNFFFTTCPSICPAMNYNVSQVQKRFKGYEDFQIVSFTVNPEHDSVEVLKAYEKEIGATPGRWYFLTGERDSIYKTAYGMFLSAMKDSLAEGGFLHSENLVLVDWKNHIRSGLDDDGNLKGVYNGLETVSINALKDDIKVLIAEYEKEKSVNEYKEEKAKRKKEKEQDGGR
jgi:protein SCO1/2